MRNKQRPKPVEPKTRPIVIEGESLRLVLDEFSSLLGFTRSQLSHQLGVSQISISKYCREGVKDSKRALELINALTQEIEEYWEIKNGRPEPLNERIVDYLEDLILELKGGNQ